MTFIIEPFNQNPIYIIKTDKKIIHCFNTETERSNIDQSVVKSFGEELEKFYKFSDLYIDQIGKSYFSFLDKNVLNKDTYTLDVGCGTDRWTKYFANKVKFIEAIDPSKAIYYANKLLGNINNVRLSIASTDNIPFEDKSFDFGMSKGYYTIYLILKKL